MGEEAFPTGCPCGRSHPTKGTNRASVSPEASRSLPGKLHEQIATAAFSGLGDVLENGIWKLQLHGDCLSPVTVKRHAFGEPYTRVHSDVRCRKCDPCLRARRAFWALAGTAQHQAALDKGLRTWFGTLTLTPEWQQTLLSRAHTRYLAAPDGSEPNWDDPACEVTFRLVRDELISEIQRYWKRLRKRGHSFKYFLVVERHKSGLPHAHWLLHEAVSPILKRELQQEWPFGHSNVSLVGGRAKRAADPKRAAWYVAKYLSKSSLTRQIASVGYTNIIRAPRLRNDPQRPHVTGADLSPPVLNAGCVEHHDAAT